MKKLYTLFILLLTVTVTVNAQNKETKKADKFYSDLRYVYAAEAYEKLLEKGERTQHVYTNLANSYYYNSNFKSAEANYARAIKDNPQPEVLYRYAQTLKSNGKYDQSNTIMSQFAVAKPDDNRSRDFLANPNYINDILAMEAGYTATPFNINTESSDFASLRVGNRIYFSSSRNAERKKYGWNQEPYLDIYEVEVMENDSLSDPKLLEGDVNTKYHEGTLDITPDGRYMFFTRVDYFDGDFEKAEDGQSKLNIYRALNSANVWRDIQTTELDSKEYSVGHPSISKDGKTIYFASEIPGGEGESDIYRADLVDGLIYNPENLGPDVNTAGKDSFPYIADDGTLYFSSNGHLGIGGMDVFMYKNGKVTNMGAPINSSLDDFAFSYESENGRGFVSSNREGGKGNDDVYTIELIKIEEIEVTVVAIDANTNMPIEGAIVSLNDADGNSMPSQTTDADGKAVFITGYNLDLMARGVKENYESGEAALTVTDEETAIVEVMLTPVVTELPKIVLNNILFDYDKSDIRPDAAIELDKIVELLNTYPNMQLNAETYADIRGSDSYNLKLTDRRAKSIVAYLSTKGIDADRLSGVGRGEENSVFDCNNNNCTEEQYQASRRSEFTFKLK
jgi:outer membrane protein OmpA-like peptidoglycan-associated protein/YHS domain-containing protein